MTKRASYVLLLCTFLAACAHRQPVEVTDTSTLPAPAAKADARGAYWWFARFEMNWEDGSRPDFSQNLIIAREIVAPVLSRHADDIVLWRFHRRAARDAAGHQFSFIFYSDPGAARRIYEDISLNPLVASLMKGGNLVQLRFDDPETPVRPDISGTSDSNWPGAMQNSWPFFIMGVSLMWLDLVEQTVDVDELAARPDLPERLEYYRDVQADLTALWRQFGHHALFHHISGIFGYEPLEMRF